MANRKITVFDPIESRFPGLIEEIRKIIEDSERAYDGVDCRSESFLWEHTMHVASIAGQLAISEGIDARIPVIAALFHDIGKFARGRYHEEGTIEEEESARIAEELLQSHGMTQSDINEVLSGLRALYNEKAKKNQIAGVLHDADFLSKFGVLGIASFFIKSTLRRRTLKTSVLEYLSKELTYAACLPLNMRTSSGRKFAERKSKDSIKFFRSLLNELREAGIADLKIRSFPIQLLDGSLLSIRMVIPPTCMECGEKWEMDWDTEIGVKCFKLCVDWDCSHCGKQLETSFCLPELA
jgi:putative nucleotidyltransferase with HDIG domain